MTKPLKKSSITDTTKLGSCGDLQVDLIHAGEIGQRKPRKRRRDQHQHRDDAEQEGELALDASLRFFQFCQFLLQLL